MTLTRMRSEMTAREFGEWQQFATQWPMPDTLADAHAVTLARVIAGTVGGKLEATDLSCLPRPPDPEEAGLTMAQRALKRGGMAYT